MGKQKSGVHTVNTDIFSLSTGRIFFCSLYLAVKYALINVTTNPWTPSINVKTAQLAWKQVRMGEKGGFCKSPIKVV